MKKTHIVAHPGATLADEVCGWHYRLTASLPVIGLMKQYVRLSLSESLTLFVLVLFIPLLGLLEDDVADVQGTAAPYEPNEVSLEGCVLGRCEEHREEKDAGND